MRLFFRGSNMQKRDKISQIVTDLWNVEAALVTEAIAKARATTS
jgi:hypothetical protein